MTTEVFETFVIVTIWDGEVVPTGTLPKSNPAGVIEKRRMPVPVNVKANGSPFQFPLVLPVTGPRAVGVNA
jgi:hypothetical protein